jgi:ABC-type transporter Mla MlaB component
MATKDTLPGLLARVANFVRSTPANTEPSESVDLTQSGESAKLSIKRMIERKAHNDAVRKREFGQLRKLWQVSPAVASELVARSSFFSDSSGYSDLEERSTTLKKIDEIEAQMSKQWWKTRQAPISDLSDVAVPGLEQKSSSSKADSIIDTCDAFAVTEISDLHLGISNMPTQSGEEQTVRPSTDMAAKSVAPHGFEPTDNSAFLASKMVLIDMGQAFSDPTLEDAAIRFANSDDAGAETVLKAALQTREAEPEFLEVWTEALLDLYRATGQQASFDSFSMDNAVRFGRPAPLWFSTPEALGYKSPSASPGVQCVWVCPVTLDRASVLLLKTHASLQRELVRLDWRLLKTITPDAGQALSDLLANWCGQSLVLHVDGLEVLDQVLQRHTPLADKQVAQFWWYCRLNILRILGERELFDPLAMEFCITYEVSPPSWQSARCQMELGLNTRSLGASESASPRVLPFELLGEVIGSKSEALKPLQTTMPRAGRLVVDCDRLIRVDFSGAGSILNWIVIAKAANAQIELHRVPCLVSAFFNLIGINEHAHVFVRNNKDT